MRPHRTVQTCFRGFHGCWARRSTALGLFPGENRSDMFPAGHRSCVFSEDPNAANGTLNFLELGVSCDQGLGADGGEIDEDSAG